MKQCSKCKALISDNAQFCTSCGANVSDNLNVQPNNNYNNGGQQGQYQRTNDNQQMPNQGYNNIGQANYFNPNGTNNNQMPNPNLNFNQNQSNNGQAPFNANMQQNNFQQQYRPATPSDNRKAYSIMSYIGILWLFGLLASPEKMDARVKFNVGQGIIASIVNGACSLVIMIINLIISSVYTSNIFGYSYTPHGVVVVQMILWMISIGISVFFMVYGIIKVSQNNDSYLPIIGKWAFYK